MSRNVVLRATFQALVGDETYELWLQHVPDAWELRDAGTVVLESGHQDFTLLALVDAADYVAQVRLKRAARYRIGYLSGDPDTWPPSSRCAFTAGSLSTVGAPVLGVASWSRTSAVATSIIFDITPADVDVPIDLYRDGVLLETLAAPLDPVISYVDANPPDGALHTYMAHHMEDTLTGPDSNDAVAFAGPAGVTGLVQSSSTSAFGDYTVSWDADARAYRVETDFLCNGVYSLVTGGAAITDGEFSEHRGTAVTPSGSTHSAFFHVRVRAEVVTFGVTDVSAWDIVNVIMVLDNPGDSNYNTCP